MTYLCPICTKQFGDRGALKNHTGTNTASARKPHPCDRCFQTFCSDASLRNHQNAPSHATMFGCNACNKKFGSKQAHRQHMGSDSHARNHQKFSSSIAPAVGVEVYTFFFQGGVIKALIANIDSSCWAYYSDKTSSLRSPGIEQRMHARPRIYQQSKCKQSE